MEQIQNIIKTMGLPLEVRSAEPFRAEEDGRAPNGQGGAGAEKDQSHGALGL